MFHEHDDKFSYHLPAQVELRATNVYSDPLSHFVAMASCNTINILLISKGYVLACFLMKIYTLTINGFRSVFTNRCIILARIARDISRFSILLLCYNLIESFYNYPVQHS
jgi:hypothetical protein